MGALTSASLTTPRPALVGQTPIHRAPSYVPVSDDQYTYLSLLYSTSSNEHLDQPSDKRTTSDFHGLRPLLTLDSTLPSFRLTPHSDIRNLAVVHHMASKCSFISELHVNYHPMYRVTSSLPRHFCPELSVPSRTMTRRPDIHHSAMMVCPSMPCNDDPLTESHLVYHKSSGPSAMSDYSTINTQAVFGFVDFLKSAAEREDPRLKTYWDIISKLPFRPLCTFGEDSMLRNGLTMIQSIYRMMSFAQTQRRFGPSKN